MYDNKLLVKKKYLNETTQLKQPNNVYKTQFDIFGYTITIIPRMDITVINLYLHVKMVMLKKNLESIKLFFFLYI